MISPMQNPALAAMAGALGKQTRPGADHGPPADSAAARVLLSSGSDLATSAARPACLRRGPGAGDGAAGGRGGRRTADAGRACGTGRARAAGPPPPPASPPPLPPP